MFLRGMRSLVLRIATALQIVLSNLGDNFEECGNLIALGICVAKHSGMFLGCARGFTAKDVMILRDYLTLNGKFPNADGCLPEAFKEGSQ